MKCYIVAQGPAGKDGLLRDEAVGVLSSLSFVCLVRGAQGFGGMVKVVIWNGRVRMGPAMAMW